MIKEYLKELQPNSDSVKSVLTSDHEIYLLYKQIFKEYYSEKLWSLSEKKQVEFDTLVQKLSRQLSKSIITIIIDIIFICREDLVADATNSEFDKLRWFLSYGINEYDLQSITYRYIHDYFKGLNLINLNIHILKLISPLLDGIKTDQQTEDLLSGNSQVCLTFCEELWFLTSPQTVSAFNNRNLKLLHLSRQGDLDGISPIDYYKSVQYNNVVNVIPKKNSFKIKNGSFSYFSKNIFYNSNEIQKLISSSAQALQNYWNQSELYFIWTRSLVSIFKFHLNCQSKPLIFHFKCLLHESQLNQKIIIFINNTPVLNLTCKQTGIRDFYSLLPANLIESNSSNDIAFGFNKRLDVVNDNRDLVLCVIGFGFFDLEY